MECGTKSINSILDANVSVGLLSSPIIVNGYLASNGFIFSKWILYYECSDFLAEFSQMVANHCKWIGDI